MIIDTAGMWHDVFNALAFPLLACAGVAAWLFTRAVLLPAWRGRHLSMRHHGLPAAMVLSFAADVIQTLYYAVGRLWPEVWPSLYYAFAPLSALRLLVLSSSVIGLAAFCAIVGLRWRLPHIAAAVLVIWCVAFAMLTLLQD